MWTMRLKWWWNKDKCPCCGTYPRGICECYELVRAGSIIKEGMVLAPYMPLQVTETKPFPENPGFWWRIKFRWHVFWVTKVRREEW